MKKYLLILFLFTQFFQQLAAQSPANLEWWQQARFGMFIHFGAYAVPARGEWVKNRESMSNEAYEKYVSSFNPVDYDPKQWAKLAKQAGMKYAVLTAKHHDGYCLFDSKLTDYKTTTYFKRDVVREFLDAFRAEGLKVGLYYSLLDWHHPDYPHYGDMFHPMKANEQFKNVKHSWNNYLQYMHGQIEELTTQYGKLDIMWFDFSYSTMTGEKWKAKELVQMVRRNQPGIILNNRLGADGVGKIGNAVTLGDFETPEQGVPETMKLDAKGNPVPWETCLTLSNNWGYNSNDKDWKTPELIVHTLVNCVSKGGNLLLNVGPDARGRIPDASVNILQQVGEWMSRNGESIYGCGPASLPKPDWGRFTQKGNLLYAHLMYPHIGHINLKSLFGNVTGARLLRDKTELPVEISWFGDQSKENVYINIQKPTYGHYNLPDEWNTVYEIELKKGSVAGKE